MPIMRSFHSEVVLSMTPGLKLLDGTPMAQGCPLRGKELMRTPPESLPVMTLQSSLYTNQVEDLFRTPIVKRPKFLPPNTIPKGMELLRTPPEENLESLDETTDMLNVKQLSTFISQTSLLGQHVLVTPKRNGIAFSVSDLSSFKQNTNDNNAAKSFPRRTSYCVARGIKEKTQCSAKSGNKLSRQTGYSQITNSKTNISNTNVCNRNTAIKTLRDVLSPAFEVLSDDEWQSCSPLADSFLMKSTLHSKAFNRRNSLKKASDKEERRKPLKTSNTIIIHDENVYELHNQTTNKACDRVKTPLHNATNNGNRSSTQSPCNTQPGMSTLKTPVSGQVEKCFPTAGRRYSQSVSQLHSQTNSKKQKLNDMMIEVQERIRMSQTERQRISSQNQRQPGHAPIAEKRSLQYSTRLGSTDNQEIMLSLSDEITSLHRRLNQLSATESMCSSQVKASFVNCERTRLQTRLNRLELRYELANQPKKMLKKCERFSNLCTSSARKCLL